MEMMCRLVMVAIALVGAAAAAVAEAPPPRALQARDFGVVGDGKADDTAAIQKGLDALAPGGGVLYLGAGLFSISATLNVPQGGTLMGEGARWENSATRILVPRPGYAAVRLGHAAAVKAICFSYPNNRHNLAPVKYPPTILLGGINPAVEDVVFDCAWDGVSTIPGVSTGQSLFRNLTGFTHNVGMHLGGIRDVVRIENVHWFVGGDDLTEKAYYRYNRVGFEISDVDGLIMSKCFIIGAKTFFRQIPTRDNTEGKVDVSHSLGHLIEQSWIEDVENGFVIEGICGITLHSANILVRGGGVGVKIAAPNLFYNSAIDSVQVRSFGFPIRGIEYGTTPGKPHVRDRISIVNCQVVDGAPALRLTAGAMRANVHDNHFQAVPGKPAIQVDRGANLFVITNNIINSDIPILDKSAPNATKLVKDNLVEPKAATPKKGSKP